MIPFDASGCDSFEVLESSSRHLGFKYGAAVPIRDCLQAIVPQGFTRIVSPDDKLWIVFPAHVYLAVNFSMSAEKANLCFLKRRRIENNAF